MSATPTPRGRPEPATENIPLLLELAIDAARNVARDGTPEELAGALHVLRSILSAHCPDAEVLVAEELADDDS